MAKNWYPIIDYEKCIGCMQCYEFCMNDAFEAVNFDKSNHVALDIRSMITEEAIKELIDKH